jgi:hypothetical protein
MRTDNERFAIVAALMAGAPANGIHKHYGISTKRIHELRQARYMLSKIADCGGAAAFVERYGEARVIENLKLNAEQYGWRRPAADLMRRHT